MSHADARRNEFVFKDLEITLKALTQDNVCDAWRDAGMIRAMEPDLWFQISSDKVITDKAEDSALPHPDEAGE
eukprot:gene16265-2880_t